MGYCFRKTLLLYATCKTIHFYMPFLDAGPPEETRSPVSVPLGRTVLGGGLSLPSLPRARAPGPGMVRKAQSWQFRVHGHFAFRVSNSSLKKWRCKSRQTVNLDCHQSVSPSAQPSSSSCAMPDSDLQLPWLSLYLKMPTDTPG